MNDKESDDLLKQLHEVISNIDTVDEKGCELLQDLDKDIRLLLERSGEQPLPVHPSMIRGLERAIGYFEVTHPDLTELLAKLMASLSNAGL
jgi:hypothetical protein